MRTRKNQISSASRRQKSQKALIKRGLFLFLGIVALYLFQLNSKIIEKYGQEPGEGDVPAPKNKGNVSENNNEMEVKQPAENSVPPPKKVDPPSANKEEELPSAKLLLEQKPPFSDSDVINLYPNNAKEKPLIKAANTVVTGYFRVRAKHRSDKYDGWMKNMLSMKDAMVIFTEPDMVDQIKGFRSHAIDRTIIVPLKLDDLPIGKLFPETFWKDQLEQDPEKKIHRSYQVFWIWLSKSWCVTQAIRMNVFKSDVFVWSDIGCFRDQKYNNKTLVLYPEVIPRNEVLQMAHRKPNPPDEDLFNDKYKQRDKFYHSGSQFVGYKDTLLKFHEYFLDTIDRFLAKDMIIVEDQVVLQSTCLVHPEICAYAPFSKVKDNSYFGLRHVLHHGDKIDYWRKEIEKKR